MMMRKLLVLLVLAGLIGAPAALATSATGTQNPHLTVAVSLSPDTATTGTLVTVSKSVKNNTARWLAATVTETLQVPSGASHSASLAVILAPGKSYSLSFSYTVSEYLPRGVYQLTLAATEARCAASCTSSATASITIT